MYITHKLNLGKQDTHAKDEPSAMMLQLYDPMASSTQHPVQDLSNQKSDKTTKYTRHLNEIGRPTNGKYRGPIMIIT